MTRGYQRLPGRRCAVPWRFHGGVLGCKRFPYGAPRLELQNEQAGTRFHISAGPPAAAGTG